LCGRFFASHISQASASAKKSDLTTFLFGARAWRELHAHFLVSAAAKAAQIVREFFPRRFSVLQHMKFADRSGRESLRDYNRTPSGMIAQRLSACH
jgi:hypothetical protein